MLMIKVCTSKGIMSLVIMVECWFLTSNQLYNSDNLRLFYRELYKNQIPCIDQVLPGSKKTIPEIYIQDEI